MRSNGSMLLDHWREQNWPIINVASTGRPGISATDVAESYDTESHDTEPHNTEPHDAESPRLATSLNHSFPQHAAVPTPYTVA